MLEQHTVFNLLRKAHASEGYNFIAWGGLQIGIPELFLVQVVISFVVIYVGYKYRRLAISVGGNSTSGEES